MRLVLAGGRGALGQRLAHDAVRAGHEVVVLTRTPSSHARHREVEWDGRTVGPWAAELAGATVVNLAGLLVDRRPTAANIAQLTASRVEPTRALVEAAAGVREPPCLWLQMSTAAIYGDAGDAVLDEHAAVADGPPQMAGVARAWEDAARGARTERLVVLRTGIVFDRNTPVFDRLTTLVKWGLGGRVASGTQWISWLHVADFLAIVRFVINTPDIDGIVHVTGPQPVQNRDLTRSLRHVMHRPPSPPTPRVLVRMGAWLMGSDPALALTGRRCIPRRLLDAGFEFAHPDIDEALADLVGGVSPR